MGGRDCGAEQIVVGRGAFIGLLALGACSIPERGPAVPSSDTVRALPLGIRQCALLRRRRSAAMLAEAALALERERRHLRAAGQSTSAMPAVSFLAVSGGGDNGAFGAGLINGWTALRHAARVQDRDRRQHRRPDRPLRLSRTGLRRRAARRLYDHDARTRCSSVARPHRRRCSTMPWPTPARWPR